MKFTTAIILASSLAASAAAAACTDNTALILGALHDLDTQAVAANKALLAIPDTGTFPIANATQLLQGTTALKNDLANATSHCKSACSFTAGETKSVYKYIAKTLYPSTTALLTNIVNHEPSLNAYKSIVASQISGVQTSVDTFGACLVSHATNSYASKAKSLVGKFDTAFKAAEAAY